jgi:hypothetical protein
MEGRRNDMEIGDAQSSVGHKELFANRENGLPRMGLVSARLAQALRSGPVLVRAVLIG